MLFLVILLAVLFAEPTTDRSNAAPSKSGAVAEMLASGKARSRTLWEKNEGVGVREERVTFRAWSEDGKRFIKPIEEIDACRTDRRSGATAFVLSGKVTGGRPPANSEIVDKAGTVWVVGKVEESGCDYSCSVRKK
jgi:hypothetical protein